MARTRDQFRMNHPVVVTLLVFAVITFMYFAAEFLRPVVLAVLLAFAISPLAGFLERRRLPRVLAVGLSVILVLGTLSGICVVVWDQLNALTDNIDQYQANIERHLGEVFTPSDQGTLAKLSELGETVTQGLDEVVETSEAVVDVQKVEVVQRPSFQERLETAVGPFMEVGALGFIVLILVVFMLLGRENLSDRIVQLFGERKISLTTRTMDDVGQRISRFLGTLAMYNAGTGLIIGVGLWLIGVEYAVLWGFLGGALRFIPYVGPTASFVMPFLFSIASSEGWYEPIMVLVLFGVMETISNAAIEPLLYGKTTGVSALGLLVAAMFWTWLWGPLGLLLSTPLTVCLAVLGKYVPSLAAFGTLLGEEAELDPDARYYQRILTIDQDSATEIVEEALRGQSRVEVFDRILIPALARAERDLARNEIDDREQAFLWRVTRDILHDLLVNPEAGAEPLAAKGQRVARPHVLGVASNDTADALVLRMLALVLQPHGMDIEILAVPESALELTEKIIEKSPELVLLSHLPPVGLTPARYLVRRLHSRLESLPIVVGRWGEGGDTATIEERLKASGAQQVVFSLQQARDYLLAYEPTSPRKGGKPPVGREPAAMVE